MGYFWIGMACGLFGAIPLVHFASRRTAARLLRLERQARANERLAELGTLTSGLAHEIKNPLSTVGLNVQLLQEDLTTQPDEEQLGRIRRRLDSLRRETQRLREILEDFLRFAGRMKLDLAPTDLHVVIDEMIDFYSPQAQAADIHLRTQLDAAPSLCPLDASLFKQALLNLLINAVHAMTTAREKQQPHGGASELLLRTRREGADIRIDLIDTGPGIDAQTLPRIFEPYFSTRRGGTGLGLPTTRRIIEEHGGTITCHSEPGRGTNFVIHLPGKSPAGA